MNSLKKLERAKYHLNILTQEVKEFIQSQPYKIYTTEEANGDLVYRLKIIKPVPEEWSLTIGDIIHNLRSSLDLLISDLLIKNGKQPDNRSAFPIYETETELLKDSQHRITGITPAARKVISKIKPYKGGNQILWKLHKLDILDKHKLIIPVGSASRSVGIDFNSLLHTQGFSKDLKLPPIFIRPADTQFPLKDGMGLFSILKQARTGGEPPPHSFAFDIAFGEGDLVMGEPIIETLNLFVIEVESILNKFKKLL